MSVQEVILLYVLYNIVYALFALPAGRLADKIGMRPVFISGLMIFAFVYIGFAFAKGKPIIGYRGDLRLSGDNDGAIVNLQVEYFIRLENSLVHA